MRQPKEPERQPISFSELILEFGARQSSVFIPYFNQAIGQAIANLGPTPDLSVVMKGLRNSGEGFVRSDSVPQLIPPEIPIPCPDPLSGSPAVHR